MVKTQTAGMEGLTIQACHTVFDELSETRQMGIAQHRITAVKCIIEQRMLEKSHLCADLMRTARLQL